MWIEGSNYVKEGIEVFDPNVNKKPITRIDFNIIEGSPNIDIETYSDGKWNKEQDSEGYYSSNGRAINKIKLNISDEDFKDVNIKYQVFIKEDNAWQDYKNLGEEAGKDDKTITNIRACVDNKHIIRYNFKTNASKDNISPYAENGEAPVENNSNAITGIYFEILKGSPKLDIMTYGDAYSKGNEWTSKFTDNYYGPFDKPINMFMMKIVNKPKGMSIQYQAFIKEDNTWQEWKNEGEKAGAIGKTFTSIRIRIVGDNRYNNVFYYISSSIDDDRMYNSSITQNGDTPAGSLVNTKPICAINAYLSEYQPIEKLDTSGSEIVVDRLYEVRKGEKFTIPEDKKIIFTNGSAEKAGFIVNGKLDIKGSSSRPINMSNSVQAGITVTSSGELNIKNTNFVSNNTKLADEFIQSRGKLTIENSTFKDNNKNFLLNSNSRQNLSILNSTIDGWENAITIENSYDENINIENNKINNNGIGINLIGCEYSGSNNSINIKNNPEINNNDVGICVYFNGEEPIHKTVNIESNSLNSNNACGIYFSTDKLSNINLIKNTINNTNVQGNNNYFFERPNEEEPTYTKGGPIYIDLYNLKDDSSGTSESIKKMNASNDNCNNISGNNVDGIVFQGILSNNLNLSEGKYQYVFDKFIVLKDKTNLFLSENCRVKAIGNINIEKGGSLVCKGSSGKEAIISSFKDNNYPMNYKNIMYPNQSYNINILEGGSLNASYTKFFSDAFCIGGSRYETVEFINSKGTINAYGCTFDGLNQNITRLLDVQNSESTTISNCTFTRAIEGIRAAKGAYIVKSEFHDLANCAIAIENNGDAVTITGCNFYNNKSNILNVYGNLNLLNSNLQGNDTSHGLFIRNAPSVNILNSTLNKAAISRYGNGTIVINYCNIIGNSGFAIGNYGDNRINATFNYWGKNTGPYQYKRPGTSDLYGVKISPQVDYEPYFGEMLTGIDIGIDDNQISNDIYKMLNDYNYNVQKSMSTEGVNPGSGNYSKSFSDLVVETPGEDINISRTYSSKNDKAGILGQGWSFYYDASIKNIKDVYNDINVEGKIVTLPGGAVETFEKDGDNNFKASDSRDKLKFEDNKYILSQNSGVNYVYNSDGKLIEIISKNKNVLSFYYNGDKLSEISDNLGRKYTLSYVDDKLVYLQETVDGVKRRKLTYQYDNGLLTSVTDVNGNKQDIFSYDENKKLSTIKRNGEVSEEISYVKSSDNTNGNISKLRDEYGNVYTYEYDLINRKVIMKDSLGESTELIYDSNMYLTYTVDKDGYSTSTDYSLDSKDNNILGEEKSVKDKFGNITTYMRNAEGNIILETLPDGSVKQHVYDKFGNVISDIDEAGNKKYYEYNEDGTFLEKIIIPLNGTDSYDENSNLDNFSITSYEYYEPSEVNNIKGLVKKSINGNGDSTEFTYDKYGNKLTEKDEEGNVTTYKYDRYGNLTNERNAEGNKKSYTYDNKGNKLSETDGLSNTTEIFYDKLDRNIGKINPKDMDKEDENGDPIFSEKITYFNSGKVKSEEDAEGNKKEYTYDLYGNKLTEKTVYGGTYRYTYDSLNRQTKIEYKDNDNSNYVVLEENSYEIIKENAKPLVISTKKIYSDANNFTTVTEKFDYLGNVIEHINNDGTKTSFTYRADGKLACTIDENGAPTFFYYNGFGEISKTYEAAEISGSNYKYKYTENVYDKAGRKIQEKVGLELVDKDQIPENYFIKTYTLNKAGKVVKEEDSEGSVTEYILNKAYNPIEKNDYTSKDSKVTTKYTYDKDDRVKKESLQADSDDLTDAGIIDSLTGSASLDTSYNYDENGNIIKVTRADGTVIDRTFDSLNRKISEKVTTKDVKGSKVSSVESYTYIGDGDKVKTFKDAAGNITKSEYANDGKLLKEIYSDGSYKSYTYDLAGKELSLTTADNSNSKVRQTTFEYDARDRKILESVKINNADGSVHNLVLKGYKYDNAGNIIKEVDGESFNKAIGDTTAAKIENALGKEYTYTPLGNIKTVLTAENKKASKEFSYKFEYDSLGNKIKEIDADNNAYTYKVLSSGEILEKSYIPSSGSKVVLQKNEYDLLGNLIKTTDAEGNISTYKYNSIGKVKEKALPYDDTIDEEIQKYKYDSLGNISETKDSKGTVSKYTYDGKGNVLKTVINGEGKTISQSNVYDSLGRVIKHVDSNGNIKTFKYDIRGNKTEESINGEVINRFEYDSLSNLRYSYDRFGNKSEVIYDEAGRKIEERNALNEVVEKLEYYDNHCQSKSIDALGNTKTFTYDDDGRLISTFDGENKETRNTYDNLGNISEIQDGNKGITKYSYDGRGNLLNVTNALGEVSKYTYDNNGNMLTVTDGNGNVTTYEYNAAGKVSKAIAANDGKLEGKVQTYTYNADGSIKNVKDKNGNVISYEYDAFGRKIKETNGESISTFDYDNVGNLINVKDPVETVTYVYDSENRTTSKNIEGKAKIFFAYDKKEVGEDGKTYYKETITDDKNSNITKTYDGAGRLVKVESNGDLVAQYNYYSNGAVKDIRFKDNSVESYVYNKNYTLDTITHVDGNGKLTDSYKYNYDNNNNILSINENGEVKSYTYDKVNRLASEDTKTSGKKTYTYDKAGNRLTESTTLDNNVSTKNYEYDSENRLIKTSIDDSIVTNFEYDNNGNLLSEITKNNKTDIVETSRVLTYDNYNRLTTVTENDKLLKTNRYNHEGLRVEKETENSITKYVYDGTDILLELDKSNNFKARNVKGIKLLSRETNTDTGYYKYNGHGDVRKVTSAAGQTLASYDYDSFGNITKAEGDFDNPYRYSGYIYDEEVNYYYLQSRMYDPTEARFLQEDTYTGDIKDPLSLNRYTYCHNNPLIYDDQNGHWPQIAIGAAVGAVVGIGINAYKDYKDDGKFNSGWKSYAKAGVKGAVVGAVTAIGSPTAILALSVASDSYNTYKANGKVTVKDVAKSAVYNYVGGKAGKYVGSAIKSGGSKLIQKFVPKVGMSLNSVVNLGGIKQKAASITSQINISSKLNSIATSLKRNINTKINTSPMLSNVKNKVTSSITKVSAKELKNTVHTTSKNKLVFDFNKNKGLNAALRGRACFVAGTKITAESGNKSIEDIKVGDRVYSEDVESGSKISWSTNYI